MNLKRPSIKRNKEAMNPYADRNFKYGYIHVSTQSLQEMFKVFTHNDLKMIFALVKIVKQHTNMLMNLANEPAENRDEILSAMGYISDTGYSKTTIRKLFNQDVLKKVKSEATFSGYAYYLNPYIFYYGGSVDDNTLELFYDSKWRT